VCKATTNQILVSKQRLQNDYIVDAIIMSYVVLQEATTTAMMVDCNKRTRLPQQQPTL
jgi:hypothetical protein